MRSKNRKQRIEKIASNATPDIEYDKLAYGMADAVRALEAAISMLDVKGINKYTEQINGFHKRLSSMKPYDWHSDVNEMLKEMR